MKPEKIRKICRKLEDGVAVFFKDEKTARASYFYFLCFYPDLIFVSLTDNFVIFPSLDSLFFFYYHLVQEEHPPALRDTIKSDIDLLLAELLSQLNK